MSVEHGTSPAEHAEFAPPEAWDSIAAGYAEHVAPGEHKPLSLLFIEYRSGKIQN